METHENCELESVSAKKKQIFFSPDRLHTRPHVTRWDMIAAACNTDPSSASTERRRRVSPSVAGPLPRARATDRRGGRPRDPPRSGVVEVDVGALVAGTRLRSMFEERMNRVKGGGGRWRQSDPIHRRDSHARRCGTCRRCTMPFRAGWALTDDDRVDDGNSKFGF